MRKVTIAAVQMSCSSETEDNLDKAEALVRKAASDGANVILLPELFAYPYFCQERRYEYYARAVPASEDPAVARFAAVAKELGVVVSVSFYERDGNRLFNSVAMLDAGGGLLGVYRKTHIPDDHYYQEKFYFTPGDTGFRVWETAFGRVGVGICWDQWFPETARALTLGGAEMLLFPTAIGSEPILTCDSMLHWRRCMQGHAAANLVPVAAANRVGTESVAPCAENGGQASALCFYGSSFISDETGELVSAAGREEETVISASFDLDAVDANRLNWGFYRDRRPECYAALVGRQALYSGDCSSGGERQGAARGTAGTGDP